MLDVLVFLKIFCAEVPFDLCFVDADKENQIAYVDLLMSEGLLAPTGTVLVDNTLWYSRVLRPREKQDASTRAVVDFNHHVQRNGQWQVTMLPIRDGITLLQPRRWRGKGTKGPSQILRSGEGCTKRNCFAKRHMTWVHTKYSPNLWCSN